MLFWDQNGHFSLNEEKYEGTGCTMAQVHLACNYMIVVWAEEPSEEDEESMIGDSGYVSVNDNKESGIKVFFPHN